MPKIDQDKPYFDDSSMLRRVHRELVMLLAGGRALLMMAAHPVVFEGFFASTGAKSDPFARLERTAVVLGKISYRPRSEADRATAAVRRMHRRATGSLPEAAGRFPKGTAYSAADPDLLLWVWTSLVDSCLLVYNSCVAQLSPAEEQSYWDDQRLVAKLFGIPYTVSPRKVDDLRAYVGEVISSGDLFVTEDALATAREVIFRPPVPATMPLLREAINQTSIGLLPHEVRDLYGFSWDPLRGIALQAGQEYLRRIAIPLAPSLVRHTPQWREHRRRQTVAS